jgi:bifunctional DNA-binding transcriptional regulator/antitoxin component of YhaV-PrlF toxin-antitoxin module
MKYEIVCLSSKGQLVIPETMRKSMGLEKGTRLMLIADGPNLLVRGITPPETKVFADLIRKSFELLKEGGKEYKALWRALQKHNIGDLYKHI